jgi:alpha-beta hydrolase superfamily lysophospholipase
MAGLPTLVLQSGADEYVPAHVDPRGLGQRLAAAIGPSATVAVIEGGNHVLQGKEDEAVALMVEFISGCAGS